MNRILLVEPGYRSKFPPLGLLRISTYHKSCGDRVVFARGQVPELRDSRWKRVYISSLFTWELPRTINTIRFYADSVSDSSHIVVGGIAATLMPEYIEGRVDCTVVTGPIDRKGKLGQHVPSLACLVPDYSLLDSCEVLYKPDDSYFCRTTKGCVRKCPFCAVPHLEPRFARNWHWRQELAEARNRFGERQNLVLLDNNVVASPYFHEIVTDICREGFEVGTTRNGKRRIVDFNQGIDARLITKKVAKALGTINLKPVRLAFDFDGMDSAYRGAVQRLADVGFTHFTTYLMFNFRDTPRSLYRRMKVNLELSRKFGVAITGFPMRFIPINDVSRQHVSAGWHWRYLRGIQCILLATHGMVSPNRKFFRAAFGNSFDEFLELISMPDRYIIQRQKYADNDAADWRKRFRRLTSASRNELLQILEELNGARDKNAEMARHRRFSGLLEHYYPQGKTIRE